MGRNEPPPPPHGPSQRSVVLLPILAAFSSRMLSHTHFMKASVGPLTCCFICSSGRQDTEKSQRDSPLSFVNKELSTCPAEMS